MRIGALQKTTLLDFPGKVSAIVFTQGCNFLCPYCHNSSLLLNPNETISHAEVLGFLARRRHLLEGVVITGGEPTLQENLKEFCSTLKSLGYAIKLDTNGSKPQVLRQLLQLKLLDYVAMDVKASPRLYPHAIAPGGVQSAIMESMMLLKESEIAHEFRVPCVAPFIDAQIFQEILDAAHCGATLFLQAIRLEQVLMPRFFKEKGRAMLQEEMELLKKQAEHNGYACHIR